MATTNITLFDYLPTEIIFIIFEYLSSNDIIYTFFFFNQRFNNLLLQNQHYFNYFELPTTNLNIWKNILSIIGLQIEFLNINTIDLSFPLSYFPNLKSIIISSRRGFPDEELKSIFESKQFENLHSFKIQEIKIFSEQLYNKHYTNQDYILKQIFNNKNSLKIFQYSLIASPLSIIDIDSLKINFNLYSLTLRLKNFNDAFKLISYTPNLKYLNIQSECPYQYEIFSNKIDIKLKELYLKLDRKVMEFTRSFYRSINVDQLTNFIKIFSSSLICLSLDLVRTNFPFNNIQLQQLLETMIELKQFHLFAKLYNNPKILLEFNDQFWFDHKWSFGMHRNYLYTLPFKFDYLPEFYQDFNDVKSNNPDINPRIWYSIKTIDLPLGVKSDLNFLKELQIKMPKLTTINFTDYYSNRSNELEIFYEKEKIYLYNITTIQLTGWVVERGKDWLIYLLPNLKHLILSTGKLPSIESHLIPILNNKIQELDIYINDNLEQFIQTSYIYFSNVQQINFRKGFSFGVENVNTIMEVLKNFKNLKILIIYSFESYITFTGKDLDERMKYFDMNQIMKTYKVKIFEKYMLFSKETFEI